MEGKKKPLLKRLSVTAQVVATTISPKKNSSSSSSIELEDWGCVKDPLNYIVTHTHTHTHKLF